MIQSQTGGNQGFQVTADAYDPTKPKGRLYNKKYSGMIGSTPIVGFVCDQVADEQKMI